jgi:hypothetical protein
MESPREEPQAAPSKMPLQRKSGEGVEIFTRLTTRPPSAEAPQASDLPMGEPLGQASQGFGKLKDSAIPSYQASRLQEVIDHTYTQTSHRRTRYRRGFQKRAGIALLTCLFGGLIGTLIWVYTRPEPPLPPPPPPDQISPGTEAASSHTPVKSTLPDAATLPPLDERHAAIRNGLTALLRGTTLEQKLPWVLHAERLSGRMKDFYLAQQGRDPAVTAIGISQPIPGQDAWWFILSLDNPAGPPIRIAAKETPEGPRFDWENLVAYSSMPFAKFLSEKPPIPQTFRLGIRSSTVFSGKYTEAEYAACEIAPRQGEPVLKAYVRRDSAAAAQTADLTAYPGWNAALLSLHWEADAGVADAVVIEQAAKIALPAESDATAGTPAAADRPGEKNATPLNSPAAGEVQSGTDAAVRDSPK